MNTPEALTNKRSSPRLPAPSTVWLRCRRAATEAGAELANGLLNLSDGGLQFLSRGQLAVGDAVAVTLAGSAMYGIICRSGEVRWVVELGGGACCAGVRFDEPLTAADVRALLPSEEAAATPDAFDLDAI